MRIRSINSVMHLGMAAASFFTLGLCSIYLYLMAVEGRASVFLVVFLTPFFLFGAVLAFVGFRGLYRRVRYGGWELEIPDAGGVLGRELQATLLPRRSVRPTINLECQLRCVNFVFAGQGRPSQQHELWKTGWTVERTDIHPETGLALTLPLPPTGRPSSESRQEGRATRWQLNVQVVSDVMSEEPVFDIPVRAH